MAVFSLFGSAESVSFQFKELKNGDGKWNGSGERKVDPLYQVGSPEEKNKKINKSILQASETYRLLTHYEQGNESEHKLRGEMTPR